MFIWFSHVNEKFSFNSIIWFVRLIEIWLLLSLIWNELTILILFKSLQTFFFFFGGDLGGWNILNCFEILLTFDYRIWVILEWLFMFFWFTTTMQLKFCSIQSNHFFYDSSWIQVCLSMKLKLLFMDSFCTLMS